MTDLWLPGWTRQPLGDRVRGRPYQYTHNPKVCLHTTEGGSIAGAVNAYSAYPPHLIYDWRSRERVQHVPLNLAAYSAMDTNDDDYLVQVELVGYARETRTWPEQALRAIAQDVVGPLEQYFRVPRVIVPDGFKDERDGILLASATSPIRLGPTELRDFAGWLGHQHLPAPDTHWDPGAIPLARIFSHLEDDVSLTVHQDAWLVQVRDQVETLTRTLITGAKRDAKINQDLGYVLANITDAVGRVGSAVAATDERVARLEITGVPVTVDYDRIAAAVVELMNTQARDGDPRTGPTT